VFFCKRQPEDACGTAKVSAGSRRCAGEIFCEGVRRRRCARTIRALRESGIRHCYISNLPVGGARQTLEKILKLA
jgi:hypothetical protein